MEYNLSKVCLGRKLQNHRPELHPLHSGQLYKYTVELIQLRNISQVVHSFCAYVFLFVRIL